MASATRIEGMDELERRLGRMTDAVQKRTLEAATRKGADTLLEFMRALAPRRTGRGARHLDLELDSASPTDARFRVGPAGEGFYLIFHEIGTVHMPPSPFMRPALAHSRREIVEDVRKELAAHLLREAE